ncbi:MAG: glycosyltransferase family 39 protein [Candidatus Poribacteria bacterium]
MCFDRKVGWALPINPNILWWAVLQLLFMNYTNYIKGILHPYRVVIIIFILIAFCLRIPLLQIRYFDPDEFQHLHGARQIYHGEIPYRDYFDHHTPFIHFILTGFYYIVGENVQILFVARSLMLVFTAIILCLTYILAKKLYDVDTGLFAALFLSYTLIFLEKTLEIRPDLGSVTFWLASMIFMIKGVQEKSRLRWHLLSGMAMGTAIMFTQKSIFGLPGIFIAVLYPFIDRRMGISWKQNLRLSLIFFGGMAIPIALTCFYFLVNHGLWQFINCNFIMNSHWKSRFSPIGYIKQLISQNPFLPILGLSGLIINIVWMYRREEIIKGAYVPIFCTLSAIAGLFIMPVPYRQYYQLFLPLLAIYSAFIIKQCADFSVSKFTSDMRSRRIFVIAFGIFIFLIIVVSLIFAIRFAKPSMPNLANFLKFAHLKANIIYIILWIPFIVSAIITFILKRQKYAFMLIAVGIIAHPLDQMINQFSQRNDYQIANIQYIMDNTTPDEAVLDGWQGFGFLRPHAYYYYFLHGEMRAMLSEKEKTDDLIKSAEKNNTKIVIYDGDMKALPQKTQDYIKEKYVYTRFGDLYIRR